MCKQSVTKELGGSLFKSPKKYGPFTHAIVVDPWGNKLDCIQPFRPLTFILAQNVELRLDYLLPFV